MIDKEPLSLSEEHRFALDQMEHTRNCLFITGRAGTGKSTLLQLYKKTSRKRIVVLAPTGVAALNVQGQTIHSFFSFPPKLMQPSDIRRHRNHRLYKNIDTIIIDEVSMVRSDMIDNIDRFLRVNRSSVEAFGGVQMIFFGDLFQLPPVVSNPLERTYLSKNYESIYFFSAHVFRQVNVQMIELTAVYRQKERRFITLLDNIRLNSFDEYDLEEINSRYSSKAIEGDYVITLTSRNAIVNNINNRKLNQIESEAYSYIAEVTGNFSPSSFPTELVLKLKLGAQVMFVRNDSEKRFVNGTIGIINEINNSEIKVEILDSNGKNKIIEVSRVSWEILKYVIKNDKIQTEVTGTFTQFPLKLAWAITIHKSQGKTFDRLIIDMGRGAFDYGQTYVALSRSRTLDGIQLTRPIQFRDIFIDDKVIDFYSNQKRLY